MSAKLKINANPSINPPQPREKRYIDAYVDGYTYDRLETNCGKAAARQKMEEMVEAFLPGLAVTPLFVEGGMQGMSLSHIWFGPNFPLFRHSHPQYGNCLYYVVAGEITMGTTTLGAGSTIFMPSTQPYRYTAGPAGVELLEFRAGGGDKDGPAMKIHENSPESVQKIIDGCYANDKDWQAPTHIGETAFRQAAIDRES